MPGKLFVGEGESVTPYIGTHPVHAMYLGAQYVGYDQRYITSISASGGNISYSGSYKIHTFIATGSSTFTIHGLGNYNNTIHYAVVGGGGGAFGGPQNNAGGGGSGNAETGSVGAIIGNYSIDVGNGGYFDPISGVPLGGVSSSLKDPNNNIIADPEGGTIGGRQQSAPFFDGRGGNNSIYTGGASPNGGGAGATANGLTSGGGPGAGLLVTIPGVNETYANGGCDWLPTSAPLAYTSGSGGNAGQTNGPNSGANGIVIISYYYNPLEQ